ncbi:MAG: MBL fold metallo-hydrolase [Parachlamydiales bacterium]|jgi:L-ascorbate metabolism protein UlaG (beta-lactamase superfamily)
MDINRNFNSLKIGGRFINSHSGRRIRRTLIDFFLWKSGFYNLYDKKIEIPINFSFPVINDVFYPNKPWALWLGHSSFLVKNKNIRLLTDPIWNETCSPFSFIGPRRRHEPPIDINQLTKIDYVLISHDHYDHLDKKTVLALHKKFPGIKWIVPLGLKKWFKKINILNVEELAWWEKYEDNLVTIHSVPAQHYSGRGLFDGNKTLWCGFVYENKEEQKKLYFTGDTGYNNKYFKLIGEKFQGIDLSLIPIGAYIPRKFMSPVHIDPQDAVQIHKDVLSKFSIGMHWKTFNLSDEKIHQPPYELYLNLIKEDISFNKFIAIDPGSYVNW